MRRIHYVEPTILGIPADVVAYGIIGFLAICAVILLCLLAVQIVALADAIRVHQGKPTWFPLPTTSGANDTANAVSSAVSAMSVSAIAGSTVNIVC